jgi:hypothetical protein
MDWKELFRDLKRSEEVEPLRAEESARARELATKEKSWKTRERFAPCIRRVSEEFIKTFGWRFGGGYLGPLAIHPIAFSLSDETTWVGPKGLDYCAKSITLALDADGSTLEMMGTCITGTRAKDNQEIRCTRAYTVPAERLNEEELAKTMVEIYKEIEAIRRMYFAEYADYKKRHNVRT